MTRISVPPSFRADSTLSMAFVPWYRDMSRGYPPQPATTTSTFSLMGTRYTRSTSRQARSQERT